MIDPPDDGEFSWAARVRTDDPAPTTFMAQLRAGGLTIGRRRALVAATFSILLLAAVLSAAAGVGGGDADLSIDVAGPPPQSTESAESTAGTTPTSSTITTSFTSTTTGDLVTALLSSPLLTTGDEPTTVPLPRRSTIGSNSSRLTSSTLSSSRLTSSTQAPSSVSESPSTTAPAAPIRATRSPSTTDQSNTSQSNTSQSTTSGPSGPSSSQATTSLPVRPANVANRGIIIGDGGSITFTDVVRDLVGRPVPGVKVDLFSADRRGKRAAFLATATADAQGRYRLTGVLATTTSTTSTAVGSTGADGERPSCAVLVFIAPDGQAFEETGRFREAVVCPEEAEAALPLVRTLSGSGSGAAAAGLRSALFGNGKLFLRGSVAGESDRQQKIARYRAPLGDTATVTEYRIAPLAPGVASTGHERISLDGTGVLAFGDDDDQLSAVASLLVWQLASVLKANPGLRLRIVIAVDPALPERPTPELIRSRQRATVAAFDEAGIGIGRLDRQTRRQVTDGRLIGGRSINSQLEFTLLWP